MKRLLSTPLSLLGLAPLLGASDLLVKALGLALAGLPVLAGFGLLLSLTYTRISGTAYWLAALLSACTLVSCADLLMQAFAFELHRALGPFLALLILPCLQLTLGEPQRPSTGLTLGLIFALCALLLGALRETLGSGTLFARMDWLFGQNAAHWQLDLAHFSGLQLFAHASGAFILLGLLLAGGRRLFTVKIDHS
ncbi:electron transporter RnfE [Pseudomonas cavernicola]|uniref:Electron transporter RnfE n=1 Tax=Pseudomonas cavernicola TaxID=2320866 RepID=A0A418XNV3_9PSED|nr:Rnf-Nqr domain containing protein [Pseudomonas cavernicola]RJG14117.1 electron transporter RnfE [Pseudomonas cavernicola]